ncbi:hypothetical protein ROZALSC1DRAFT_25681, partial [Rozella allomycis CSF55]
MNLFPLLLLLVCAIRNTSQTKLLNDFEIKLADGFETLFSKGTLLPVENTKMMTSDHSKKEYKHEIYRRDKDSRILITELTVTFPPYEPRDSYMLIAKLDEGGHLSFSAVSEDGKPLDLVLYAVEYKKFEGMKKMGLSIVFLCGVMYFLIPNIFYHNSVNFVQQQANHEPIKQLKIYDDYKMVKTEKTEPTEIKKFSVKANKPPVVTANAKKDEKRPTVTANAKKDEKRPTVTANAKKDEKRPTVTANPKK